MSKGVRDRIQLSRSVILAGYLYADVVGDAWNRRLHEFRHCLLLEEQWERAEQWSAVILSANGRSLLFQFIAMDLEELGEAMVARDETLARRRAGAHREQQRRDRLAKKVYRELSETRKFFMGILGYQEGCDYLGLKGPTPRDPAVLLAWARRAVDVLTDDEKSPARDYTRDGKVKTSDLAERLATRCTALQEAITAVAMANQTVIAALDGQRKAIAAFDEKHTPGARLLETALDFLGLPSLAETVRPGVKRRGRPAKQRPVDAYPDLVARMLGEERQEETEEGSRELKEADRKIEKGSRELEEADQKIEKGSRNLSTGERKVEKDSRKLGNLDLKSENPVRKPARRDSNPTFVRLRPPRRRPGRRIVHGVDLQFYGGCPPGAIPPGPGSSWLQLAPQKFRPEQSVANRQRRLPQVPGEPEANGGAR